MTRSALEEQLAWQLKAAKVGSWVREYRFHQVRRWRFDFADPDRMIAIEVEGLSRTRSRHTSFRGYRADCEKYNHAALAGWCVLRFTDREIRDGSAIKTIEGALLCRKNSTGPSIRAKSGAEPMTRGSTS